MASVGSQSSGVITQAAGGPVVGRVLLATGLLVISFNLRPIFSSLAPVLPELMARLQISPAWASVLTTGPVLCLGIFALLTPWIALRVGAERAALVALVALTVGTALRWYPGFPVVLLGSLVGGAGIALLNVLLPGLVKRDFPDRAALMTGSYSMFLCAGAALAAGVTVPLSRALGGAQEALAAWSLPALAATLLWAAIQWRHRPSAGEPAGRVVSTRLLWRERLAWAITLFMGMQSALAYCVFGWLAPILRERGMDPTLAGIVVSVSILTQVLSSFLAPQIASRFVDQRAVALTLVFLAGGGLAGAMYAPLWSVWIWALIQGLGQGGLFSVTMTFIVLRSPDARTAASLSGMAQGIGYVLAGCGPLLVGLIRDRTGSFELVGYLIGLIVAIATAASLGAGRNATLPSVVTPAA